MLINQALAITFAALASSQNIGSGCTSVELRREWRQLSSEEQRNYIDAVQCLTTKESRIGLTTSLYDDFPYVHNALNKEIHLVASFLPWHRFFIMVYEEALRECGYQGSATYWDWVFDSSDTAHSPLWDAATGFGGNGGLYNRSRLGCVSDGPFKDFRPAYKRNKLQPHCLSRDFNNGTQHPGDMSGPNYDDAAIRRVQAADNYNSYRKRLEGGPHFAIHRAIGGDMVPATSPNDPIFFLHHGQIDRLWYLWQQDDPERRDAEYSGIRTQNEFDGTAPPQASVDDILPMYGLAEDMPVSDFLSTQNGLLCYQY
ncbi:uncharacterized protein BKCO1_3300057 [Diplodia corticola]|uniref:Tyrosinase copper-binding domain-containing protein n=1 Tax=Diplodia corticola TaxID=236234 RepID=A0A1J9QXP9_9PEZI|nr:uncharacterized protein BKCO1_3300057 [Diplodia corticola]OJD33145.1 hypothetical protein BKCO1_3300057 [Diplodia corticola]